MTAPDTMRPYPALLRLFVNGMIAAPDFETPHLFMFKSDSTQHSEDIHTAMIVAERLPLMRHGERRFRARWRSFERAADGGPPAVALGHLVPAPAHDAARADGLGVPVE